MASAFLSGSSYRAALSVNHHLRTTTLRGLATAVNPVSQKDCRSITPPYAKLNATLNQVKRILNNRPLTLAEKIVYSHLTNPEETVPVRGETYLKLSPDRVAMQDASAQMALLQFMLSGMATTAVPSSIHCDHLIEAFAGADKDVEQSIVTNKEIFDFLESAAKKYGIAFWKPGSGIIHQIVLENYAAPGGLMLGTDSHTPNAGGLGMIAIGVGGADAVDAMANIPWELKAPNVIGVKLTGQLSPWASPKDVILKLAGDLTVRGGTGHIIEYFGEGVESLSCTGMATMCNMGAEVGATTSLFPYTKSMQSYLAATGRSEVGQAADANAQFLRADEGSQYDKVIEINLSEVEPRINGPFTPDLSTPLSQFKDFVRENGWKDELSAGLIGSCTNSSYQDMSRAASIAQQAADAGISVKSKFLVTPGSEQIRATIERDGQSAVFEKAGAQVLANACGPCIGQWNRTDINKKAQEENAILTSFNRNFRSRNDGNPKTMNFLAAPEIVTAMAFSGKLSFNPMTDTLLDKDGKEFRFQPPQGDDLPSQGFEAGRATYDPPSPTPTPDSSVDIVVSPTSNRLQVLDAFEPWNGQEFKDVRVLVKVQGKCTTDHISAAGPWLKYKGHLENIAENTLIGALNADNGQVNVVRDITNNTDGSIPEVAKSYKKQNIPWMVIADHNYGEGSAREHAALQVRYLGCPMIISRSFARIHETNLKKQGVLPLTFVNEDDYKLISGGDSIETVGVKDIAPGKPVTLIVTKADGSKINIDAKHTMSKDQIEWFQKGSALNLIKEKASANA
ncbi:aconitate hydratase [Radiomyces spectabilis]|uniref:aconitate hydratase n=1 Tax=Radiomyces spectabilis TaxID=64574 RepID=UPI00221F0854|nr:aconitate hydratase [Radiomyces spectabilis]KAI8369515.1 aconitate hydratase [Radiomyces spectabilis]